MGRQSYSAIKILGREGKIIDIIPTTKGMNLTEVYNKKFEYLFQLIFVKHKGKKQFVMVDLNKDFQVSKDCIDEAFKMTRMYWRVDMMLKVKGKEENEEIRFNLC